MENIRHSYPRSRMEEMNSVNFDGPAYIAWGTDSKEEAKAFVELNKAVQNFNGISHKARGRFNQDLSNLATNVSGRPGLSKSDYYAFRPEEAPARSYKGAMADANMAYQTVGIIRNVIDLMADFACHGIRLVHPNKRIEKFYQNWFARVDGQDRSERFLNYLYRIGTIIVRKQNAKLKSKDEKTLYKAVADSETEIKQQNINKKEIPWRYTFLNPLFVDIVGGALASFVGDPTYMIKLPRSLATIIKNPKTTEAKMLVARLPKEIIVAASKPNASVVLDKDKTSVFSYKKDDWQPWAYPMIYAIMDDIAVLEKLRLADMAALDGAISNIRIFKLGSLEYKIMPGSAMFSRLAEILESNVGGGTMDLVWGPDIELIESKTAVHQFLGGEKYAPHLTAIYAGLGIPPTLTGTLTGSGTTNNLVSLKTLLSRLEYGRNVLTQFWNKEIVAVQRAMGFRFPAKVEFRLAQLGDEAAEKALLVQLADRSLISNELIQHLFGNDSELERIRINREDRERYEGKMVQKAGPFHDPQFGIALKKLALQSGVVTPGQVGLKVGKDKAPVREMRLFPKESGEKPGLIMRQPQITNTPIQDTNKGVPQQGRPKNARDKQKRKPKRFVPKTKAVVEIWAKATQLAISEILNPLILQKYNKKNMRSLTQAQADCAENVKFGVLCNIEPLGVVDEKTISGALYKNIPSHIYSTYVTWVKNIEGELERHLTLDELKHVQATVYASCIGDD